MLLYTLQIQEETGGMVEKEHLTMKEIQTYRKASLDSISGVVAVNLGKKKVITSFIASDKKGVSTYSRTPMACLP